MRPFPTAHSSRPHVASSIAFSVAFSVATAIALTLLAAGGCAGRLDYSITARFPQKDVAAITVLLERPADLDAYRRIASAELERFRRLRARDPTAVDLYRVRIDIRNAGNPVERFATLVTELSPQPRGGTGGSGGTDSPAAAPRWLVTLY